VGASCSIMTNDCEWTVDFDMVVSLGCYKNKYPRALSQNPNRARVIYSKKHAYNSGNMLK